MRNGDIHSPSRGNTQARDPVHHRVTPRARPEPRPARRGHAGGVRVRTQRPTRACPPGSHGRACLQRLWRIVGELHPGPEGRLSTVGRSQPAQPSVTSDPTTVNAAARRPCRPRRWSGATATTAAASACDSHRGPRRTPAPSTNPPVRRHRRVNGPAGPATRPRATRRAPGIAAAAPPAAPHR
jgi:hypothetical protein